MKQIKKTNDPYQTQEENNEIFKNKINEIIKVLNENKK